MDCQHAQQTLDAARPDRSDWDAPELTAAVTHLNGCDACREAMGCQRVWDERLADAFQEVVVPASLQDRLLAVLSAADDPLAARSPAGNAISRPRRRWITWTMIAAVVALIGAIGWQMQGPRYEPLSLTDLYARLDQELLHADAAARHTFDGRFNAVPSDPVWQEAVTGVLASGLDLDGTPGDEAAAYRFAEGRVSGWLIVLPSGHVANPPAAAIPEYANFHLGAQPRVAWTSDEHVYVCVLDRGVSAHDLLRTFYGTTA